MFVTFLRFFRLAAMFASLFKPFFVHVSKVYQECNIMQNTWQLIFYVHFSIISILDSSAFLKIHTKNMLQGFILHVLLLSF